MAKGIFIPCNLHGINITSRMRCFVHTSRLKMCASIVCLISCVAFAFASTPNHYIIAFDQSVPKLYQDIYKSKDILRYLDDVLSKSGFDFRTDYISMVGYTMDLENPSIEGFVTPYEVDGQKMLWSHIPKSNLFSILSDWQNVKPGLKSGGFASTQTIAKVFAVMETAIEKDSMKYACHTYLVMVTDDQLNGSKDYTKEWKNITGVPEADKERLELIKNDVFNDLMRFDNVFKFDYLSEHSKILSSYYEDSYKIMMYEVVGLEQPSIHSLSDIPSPLPLQRVRGGYRIDVDAHTLSPKYKISKVEIFDSKGTNMGSSNSGKFDITLPSNNIAVGDSLILSLSISLYDGLYNGVIITPENPRYHDGMTLKQVVKIQDEAKVLGILPLSDLFWWWFPNDIFSAVMVWDLIILIILIVIIGFVLYRWFVRINAYKPSNDKLKITKI